MRAILNNTIKILSNQYLTDIIIYDIIISIFNNLYLKGVEMRIILSFTAGVLFCIAVGCYLENLDYSSVKRMKVTAYCPCEKCCGKYSDGLTAIGRNAKTTLGVAADPKLLPYGTKLEIPGIGVRKVDDTGGAMRQSAKKGIYHIDVRFHNHEQALNFGVRWLNVKVLH